MADYGSAKKISPFNRNFFNGGEGFTRIGNGSLGGKAQGLALIRDTLAAKFQKNRFQDIIINIPTLTVITTHFFDRFMEQNDLYEIVASDLNDDHIASHFQKTELPAEMIGDLRALIAQVRVPLAIRSSSLLEDAAGSPFAGVYGTKMIPNNQYDTDTRFRKFVEAVKFVYASTFFKNARDYMKAAGHSIEQEKMAVIIQEVVGLPHDRRFYPNISGVARSYNFYPLSYAKPQDGVVNLALGLGKMIVDGGLVWYYSPRFPRVNPPYKSTGDLLKSTQKNFWAVNTGKPPPHDPINEAEYLLNLDLMDAEYDEVLPYIASTYDIQSDRVNIGTTGKGPRIITFAPILQAEILPLNELLLILLDLSEKTYGHKVEIEFAMTFDPRSGRPPRFGFLQVRPLQISAESVKIEKEELKHSTVLVASERVLGNGTLNTIEDVVYLKPDNFDLKYSRAVAVEIEALNRRLMGEGRPYLLIGFGRWGSSDDWLGIPVNWSQIAGAKAIVECTLPEMSIDLSQGAHFFHNISNLGIYYFSLEYSDEYQIDWEWLDSRQVAAEAEFLKHVHLASPLKLKVDGKRGMGVIFK